MPGAEVHAVKIDYGRWRSLQGYGAFAAKRPGVPLFVQFSGGATSAFMALMAPDDTVFSFQNTGREHERTLEFIGEVEAALGRDVMWLEFRPPKRKGAPPREFRWERVNFKTAARKGEPFAEFMEAINAYRTVCGNPLIAPWVRQRICTVHLKHRVLDHWMRDNGIHEHDRWVGLRADEPHRVAGLQRQESLEKRLIAPLYDAGVTKDDIDTFWERQPFKLGIPQYEGNCDGCFLKDQGDIARALGTRPDAVEYWAGLQEKYPRFGGEGFAGYRALASELPARLAIEKALREGGTPTPDQIHGVEPRRFRLLLAQEDKRFRYGPTQFSCNCESTMADDEDAEGDELAPAQRMLFE